MDFQVQYGALDQAAADITTVAGTLDSCLRDLEQPPNQLVPPWDGQRPDA